jgi:hypothetical protein
MCTFANLTGVALPTGVLGLLPRKQLLSIFVIMDSLCSKGQVALPAQNHVHQTRFSAAADSELGC